MNASMTTSSRSDEAKCSVIHINSGFCASITFETTKGVLMNMFIYFERRNRQKYYVIERKTNEATDH